MDKIVKTLAALGIGIAVLGGCQKKEEAPAAGPAEQLGRKLDQAAAEIAPKVNELGQKAGEAMQEAGQKLQQKAQEAKRDDSGSK